jgi:hypothetical protein
MTVRLVVVVLVGCGSGGSDAPPDAVRVDSSIAVPDGPQADAPVGEVNVVCDDFERTALGPDWVAGQGTGIVGASDFGVTATGGGAFIRWQGSVLGADQFSEAAISADRDPDMMVQVAVRFRSSDGARYGFHHNLETDPDAWQIKYDGVPTPQTAILAANTSLPAPGAGDTLRIEAVGNTIRGLVRCATCADFVEVVTATDTRPVAITGAGPPSLVARARNDVANPVTYPAPVAESWCGGEPR